MGRIQAILVDPNAPARLSPGEKEVPSPAPHETLIRVAAVSLNRGEVNRSQSAEAGFNPGWDLLGTVERAAADGLGPPEGARVVGLMSSSGTSGPSSSRHPRTPWRSCPKASRSPKPRRFRSRASPASTPLRGAATSSGARCSGTGASGGARDLAVRLGRPSGGRVGTLVVALVRRAEHEGLAREAGAHEVPVGEVAKAAEFGPYDLILDSVGGPVLGGALSMLATGGSCGAFGGSAAHDVTFDIRGFYLTGGASVYGFILFHEVLSRPVSVASRSCRPSSPGGVSPRASRSRHRGRRSGRSRGGSSTGASPARPCCMSRTRKGT